MVVNESHLCSKPQDNSASKSIRKLLSENASERYSRPFFLNESLIIRKPPHQNEALQTRKPKSVNGVLSISNTI